MSFDLLSASQGLVLSGDVVVFPYPNRRTYEDYLSTGAYVTAGGVGYSQVQDIFWVSYDEDAVRVRWGAGPVAAGAWALRAPLTVAAELKSNEPAPTNPASRYGLVANATSPQSERFDDAYLECMQLGAILQMPPGRFADGARDWGIVGQRAFMTLRGAPNFDVNADMATDTRGTIIEADDYLTGPMFNVLADQGVVFIEDIGFFSGQGFQDDDDACAFNFEDQVAGGRSGQFRRVRFARWRGGFIRLGLNRNRYVIEQCVGINCGWESDGVTAVTGGKDAVLLGAGDDGRMFMCDWGEASRKGLFNNAAGTFEADMVNCFANIGGGYHEAETARGAKYLRGSLDRNRGPGYLRVGPTDGTRGYKSYLSQTRFSGNSFSEDGTYDDIRLVNCHGDVDIDGVEFVTTGATANKVRYNINAEGTTTDIAVTNVRLTGGASYVTGFTNDASRLIRTIPGRGQIAGLEIANDTTDATNDFTVTAGVCKDDADTLPIQTSATILKQLDVEFAEYSAPGTASGGRAAADNLTGAKWFHIYMIAGFGKPAQPFAATSLTPTLPTGFTRKRRIGSIYWTGSTIKAFTQNADQFIWVAGSADLAAGTWTSTAANSTLLVPLGVKVEALLGASFTSSSGAQYARIEDPISTDGGVSATSGIISSVNGTLIGTTALRCRTDTSSRVRRRSSDASGTGSITTRGWYDPRGRDI